MIENLSKPVVFTGSQIPIGVLRTDGRENLITAVEIAAAKSAGKAIVPEVCIYFQNKLLRATRTIKYSSEELDVFRSDNYPALAEVGVTIQYNRPFIQSAGNGRIKIHTDLNCSVAVIRLFPGLQPELLQTILGNTILKGVVLETYGSGNAPTESWFIDVLEETIRRNVVILNVSQCPHASVKMELYETGKRMQEIGVISGHDMTAESGITKLMWLLGQNLSFSRLKELLGTSVRGEITI